MKRILASASAILFALTVVINAFSAPAHAPGPGIQLAWFYRPPSRNLFPVLQENFDFLILSHKDEAQRDELRTMGVTASISQYLLMAEIRDPGDCTSIPFGNQAAWKAGDFCMIDSQHPDWFLLDSQGGRIGGGDVYFMDPGNPGFREFWLNRARELQEQEGWNSIFIDNVFAGLGKYRSLNRLPEKYKTNEEYQAAVKGFLEYLRTNYFLPAGRNMYANIAYMPTKYTVWHQYLESLDGVLVENFAAGWLGRDKSRAEWEAQMNALEVAHRGGKTTILVAQGEQNDAERQAFSFASYLLIANQQAFFRYAKSGVYDQIWLYEDYELNLGMPLSSRYREGANWRRDFLNGYVIVNPDTVTAEIMLAPNTVPTPTSFGPPTSTPIGSPQPTTPNLDNFDRVDGPLGSNWNGSTGSYRILGNQVDVQRDGPIYWMDAFGVNQEAYVTLDTIDPYGLEQDLLLKVQGEYGPNWGEGVIEVLYEAAADTVTVWTFRLDTLDWFSYPAIPVAFVDGDQFGAQALATGEVVIFKNGLEVGRVTLNSADQAFFNPKGGYIGLWFIDARNAFFDDLGGGSMP